MEPIGAAPKAQGSKYLILISEFAKIGGRGSVKGIYKGSFKGGYRGSIGYRV